ncbi:MULTISPECIES: OB-fold domain-containing protein [unclassified Rhodococcus (in: high G+C Gram-positive bacteria)]|jgi:uncharacterized OB-fold protein|uniref:Zn-ribbon domain-containing OB-fold protein n=1 Tax=Rhodococcus TaxID=1827 RepID=UPI001F0DC72C|nr:MULTISPECIES: OB-fold domain-containing protein [unclassified Rhodococcus (in: high G+C Gram-positive bacteria)]WAM14749.1 OB-fold domain-containing protein [Rhodococcus sp. JS3073]
MISTGSPLRSDVVNLEPQGLKGIACRVCSRRSFPERPLCPHCGADAVDNVLLAGRGRVVSWTVVHQAPPPLQTPYTLVTVDLDDGVRLLGAATGAVEIDDEVAVELFTLKTDSSGEPLWWYRFRGTEENR